ncbi:hypothetical protein PENSPDRAFT_653547 [Peniophora sp. CONT]|nr:hypothetical protein PENSPDRAFT_653547 [Peniophora sp. CONT]
MHKLFGSDMKSVDGPSEPSPPDYPSAPAPLNMLSTSHNIPVSTFACMLLSRSDRVRLLGFPDSVIPSVTEAIRGVWALGIQSSGPYEWGGYEWKLPGRPWYGSGREAVPARRLIVHILHALAVCGWELAFSSDLTKKSYDKDTLFFKAAAPVQRYFFSISFNESDKIRLIESPNAQVTDAFVDAVSKSWTLGIQETKEKEANCLQMKLKGNPWWASNGAQVCGARLLGCAILATMDAHGFELIGSVDMSIGGGDSNPDLDTWFFANKLR